MRDKFGKIECTQYKKLDKDIGDVLHQVYKEKCGGTQELSRKIFGVLQSELATKKSFAEAKNYKKLLAAIQKSKLLHAAEITDLFNKTKRFLGKDTVKKEKEKIKQEVIESIIIEGVKPKQEVESQNDEGGWEDEKEESYVEEE